MFVSAYARPREFKLAHAARLAGNRVTLVAKEVQFPELARRYFDEHHVRSGPWDVLDALESLRPDVVHLFVNYNNFEMLPVLLFAPAPVVYDPYDCLKGMMRPTYQADWLEIRSEKRCFEEADHVCSRSLEPRYLRRHFGYRMPATTYFPDYCWRKPQPRAARRLGEDDPHVVYCGGIWPEDRYAKEEFGYAQYIEVARILADQRVHLHVYPSVPPGVSDFDEFYSLYIAEDRANPYFHFHRSMPYGELLERLPDFDAALHVFGAGVDADIGRVTRVKLHHSTANKLFDYIEAGLPVVIHGGTHQAGVVRHYGTAIRIDSLHEARRAILASRDRRRDRVEGCDLESQAPRLSRMYRATAEARGRMRA